MSLSPSSSSEAVWEALGPELRAALRAEALLLGVPLSRYPDFAHVPQLRDYETLATLRVAAELEARGETAERALFTAAARLGTNADTVRSRKTRAGIAARDGRASRAPENPMQFAPSTPIQSV